MTLSETIVQARKEKGITQQELSDLTMIDLRTIQRIERGKSRPRAYTIKAIENALGFKSKFLDENKQKRNPEDTKDFLHLFCLSCFSYLVIPYVHFLIPNYLLKTNKDQCPEVQKFAKNVIHEQIYWVIGTTLVFLLVLLVNFMIKYYFNSVHYISYLIPFFGMYALNGILISLKFKHTRAFAV